MAKVTLDLMLRCVADKSSYSSTVLNLLLHKLSMARGDPGVTLALLQVDSNTVLTLTKNVIFPCEGSALHGW